MYDYANGFSYSDLDAHMARAHRLRSRAVRGMVAEAIRLLRRLLRRLFGRPAAPAPCRCG